MPCDSRYAGAVLVWSASGRRYRSTLTTSTQLTYGIRNPSARSRLSQPSHRGSTPVAIETMPVAATKTASATGAAIPMMRLLKSFSAAAVAGSRFGRPPRLERLRPWSRCWLPERASRPQSLPRTRVRAAHLPASPGHEGDCGRLRRLPADPDNPSCADRGKRRLLAGPVLPLPRGMGTPLGPFWSPTTRLSEPVVEPSAVTRGEGPVTRFGVPAQAM